MPNAKRGAATGAMLDNDVTNYGTKKSKLNPRPIDRLRRQRSGFGDRIFQWFGHAIFARVARNPSALDGIDRDEELRRGQYSG